MKKFRSLKYIGVVVTLFLFTGCKLPQLVKKENDQVIPEAYTQSLDSTAMIDSTNTAEIKWREFFSDDPYLVALIDTALANNQELNIMMQEIDIAQAEVRTRKGEYLPFVNVKAGAGAEKVGRYTSQGANDANTDIAPGKEFPEPLTDLQLMASATWEVDIWHKLRNSRDAAIARYLGTIEGRNFMVTQLVSEIANSYYELLGLDNKLQILKQNIEIQKNALEIVKLQKISAKTTELAVRKFEAEVLKNLSHQYEIEQMIVEQENKLNFLLGRFPQHIERSSQRFVSLVPDSVYAGLPTQLLENRPDIRQAELEMQAANLDIKVAKADFYPALRLTAGFGAQSFNPAYFARMPESLLYSMVGDLVAPLINRNSIKARYFSANARQIQAIYDYEQTVLSAYIEVSTHLSKISNYKKSYDLKSQQVDALQESITISINLFKSARADYMEVLLTQRDALEARFELIENKMEQMNALIGAYRALGGGWN